MRLQRCLLALTVAAVLLACSSAQETVDVKLVFKGVAKSDFDKVASKVADAIAAVAGVPSDYVSMASSGVGSSSTISKANSSVSASMLLDGTSSDDANEIRESAPSQLPSTLATAPGYIRAQYTEQSYAAAVAAAAAASTGSSTTGAGSSTTGAGSNTTGTGSNTTATGSNATSTGGSTTGSSGTNISSAVPRTVTSATFSTGNATKPTISTSQHQQQRSGNGSSGSSIATQSQTGLVSTPIVPARISASVLDRKLLAVESTTVEYAIKANPTAGPWAEAGVIRQKILASAAGFGQASSAGFGKGFYATLEKSGVPYQPTVYLDGVKILSGGLNTDAPKSRFGQRQEDDPRVFDPTDLANVNGSSRFIELRDVRAVALPSQPVSQQQFGLAPWLIGVIVAAGVLALGLGGVLVWKCCCCAKRDKSSDDASQGSSQSQFITDDGETVQV